MRCLKSRKLQVTFGSLKLCYAQDCWIACFNCIEFFMMKISSSIDGPVFVNVRD